MKEKLKELRKVIKRGLLKINRNVSINPTISIEECPWPHNSKQNPLCSPLKRERKVEAKLIRPGIASILIPKQ